MLYFTDPNHSSTYPTLCLFSTRLLPERNIHIYIHMIRRVAIRFLLLRTGMRPLKILSNQPRLFTFPPNLTTTAPVLLPRGLKVLLLCLPVHAKVVTRSRVPQTKGHVIKGL